MKITKVLENLYKLEPSPGKYIKCIENNDVYEGAIYFGKEEYKDLYEEITEEEKIEIEKLLEEEASE